MEANEEAHAWRPEAASARVLRSHHHQARRAHLQGDGRRLSGRVRQRHQCGALRGRNPARHARAQRRSSRRPPYQVPHRHQSRRHHRRRRRFLRRRRQPGGAARRPGGTRRNRLLGDRAPSGRQQARAGVHRPRRADASRISPSRSMSTSSTGRTRRRGPTRRPGAAARVRGPTSRRWQSCRSPT